MVFIVFLAGSVLITWGWWIITTIAHRDISHGVLGICLILAGFLIINTGLSVIIGG